MCCASAFSILNDRFPEGAAPSFGATIETVDTKCRGAEIHLATGTVLVSWPKHHGCGQSDVGAEDLRAPFGAGSDPAPGLRAFGHALVPVAAFAVTLVVLDEFAARGPARDARLYPFVVQRITDSGDNLSPTVFGTVALEARGCIIWAKIPLSVHRLSWAFGAHYSLGAACLRKPL